MDAERPPLPIFFDGYPLAVVTRDCEQRLATWRGWEAVSKAAQGSSAPA